MGLTKASPSKQVTVAFPGLNYDITRFARIFRVGNGYCGINIEKIRFAPRTGKPTDLSGFGLYTRYPIVARRAWPTGRVRRVSKGILHTRFLVKYQFF